jgi:hypothetical protein
MAVQTLLNLPSAARASYTSGPIILPNYNNLVLDCDFNVTAFTGGTAPTVTFKVSRVGADGILYQVWQPTAISAAGPLSQSIGPGYQTAVDLGDTFQIDMVVTGAPTSITFSGSVKAKGF